MSLSAMSVSGVEEYEARAGRAMDRANHHSEVRVALRSIGEVRASSCAAMESEKKGKP